jgi:two-component SAPR family response regulator
MPKLNGNELAEKIKFFYPDIKVIFMSGYTNDIIDNHGVLKPGFKFIEKPFLSEDLERRVREILMTD